MGWVMIIAGLLIALASSALLLMGRIESGLAVAIGILGIGLIAASGRWIRKKPEEKAGPEPIERTIYAPDRQLRALVRRRADGNYLVEIEKFVHDYSQDYGTQDRWERQPEAIVTDTRASAIEVAARSVGAVTDNFF